MTTLTKMKCLVDYCVEVERTKGYCGRHYTSLWRNGSAVVVDVVAFPTSPNLNIKFCTKCLNPKPLDSFHIRERGGKSRVDGACKQCISGQTVDYRKNRQPVEVTQKLRRSSAISKAKKNYGEDALEIQERILSGEGCEVCGGYTKKMAIDHCHDSGLVRGLLCSKCNTALGLADDSIERLQAMISYLESHGEKMKASAAAKRAARRG